MSTTKTRIRKIGNSTGLILPKELVQRLGLEPGTELTVTETPEGGFRVTRGKDFKRAMDVVEDIMSEYRDTLHELAK